MLKKIIYHLVIVLILSLTIGAIVDRIEDKNPVIKAISEIRFSDLYFSIDNKLKPSSEIFIVDIGDKDPVKSREEIAIFIEKVNANYKPKVIGVDVYFDAKYKEASINKRLISALSDDNVIKSFKLEEVKFGEEYQVYANHSFLPTLVVDTKLKDGYTSGLGDPSKHTCVRFFKPTMKIDTINHHHFSKLIAQKYLEESDKKFSSSINFNHKMMINYNVEFSQNMIDINDSTRYHELKNKIVLIGINTYKNGKPYYNDDVHFTPKNKNYIGRSEKDSYGIEILGNIISNLINHNDALSYSPNFVKWLNRILSLIIYIVLLYLFVSLNEYFVFFKILSQTVGLLFLLIFSVAFIKYTSIYIDLSFSIMIMFISAEIVEVVEELLQRLPKYSKKILQNLPNLSKNKISNE